MPAVLCSGWGQQIRRFSGRVLLFLAFAAIVFLVILGLTLLWLCVLRSIWFFTLSTVALFAAGDLFTADARVVGFSLFLADLVDAIRAFGFAALGTLSIS